MNWNPLIISGDAFLVKVFQDKALVGLGGFAVIFYYL